MNDVVHKSSGPKKKRKHRWAGRLAMTVGPLLLLIIYFLLLEQNGFPILDLNGDEQVVEATP
jgi:hypothetical protein